MIRELLETDLHKFPPQQTHNTGQLCPFEACRIGLRHTVKPNRLDAECIACRPHKEGHLYEYGHRAQMLHPDFVE